MEAVEVAKKDEAAKTTALTAAKKVSANAMTAMNKASAALKKAKAAQKTAPSD